MNPAQQAMANMTIAVSRALLKVHWKNGIVEEFNVQYWAHSVSGVQFALLDGGVISFIPYIAVDKIDAIPFDPDAVKKVTIEGVNDGDG